MVDGRRRRDVSDDFHTVGDTILLNQFDYRDGARDIKVRLLHVSDAVRTVQDVKWVRVLAVEMKSEEEQGTHSLFVIHVDALRHKKPMPSATA